MIESSDKPANAWLPAPSGPSGPSDVEFSDRDLEDARLLNQSTEEIALEEYRPAGSNRSSEDSNKLPELRSSRFGRILSFLDGPRNPLPYVLRPIFPAVQRQPSALVDVLLPTPARRSIAKSGLFLVWLATFTVLVVVRSRPLHDGSSGFVHRLACEHSLWPEGDACGLDGVRCAPFSNTSIAFACPAHCSTTMVLEPRRVGPVDVVYKPFLVGSGPYRADSFVCAAGLHAGVISLERGGCGRLKRVGRHESFAATTGEYDMESVGFDSYFPFAFTVEHDSSIECDGPMDLDRLAFLATALFTLLACIFGTSPAFIFFSIFAATFACVAFVSDPPPASYMSTDILPDRISAFAGHFLPASFCAVIVYLACVRRALDGLAAPAEKSVLWLGALWFGALSNRTFEWLPIQRLTVHDLQQQPGAMAALAGIVVFLAFAVVGQAYCFWREGRLRRYLVFYLGVLVGLGLIGVLAAPGNLLRLHHYVFALILLPGTSLQTRPSLIYQGLLIGLFINGIARWGFASVLETPAALRGDGQFGSPVPEIPEPVISLEASATNIAFTFPQPSSEFLEHDHMDGISAVVNDVERLRGFFGQENGVEGGVHLSWTRQAEPGEDEYMRFAFVKDGHPLDYTKTHIWFSNGTFV